jgi:hypothetical protein
MVGIKIEKIGWIMIGRNYYRRQACYIGRPAISNGSEMPIAAQHRSIGPRAKTAPNRDAYQKTGNGPTKAHGWQSVGSGRKRIKPIPE